VAFPRAGSASWQGVGGEPGAVGDGWDPTVTEEPFYTSGFNAEFVIINGVYDPVIAMQARGRPHLSFCVACCALLMVMRLLRAALCMLRSPCLPYIPGPTCQCMRRVQPGRLPHQHGVLA
jgi:hypothetical protein